MFFSSSGVRRSLFGLVAAIAVSLGAAVPLAAADTTIVGEMTLTSNSPTLDTFVQGVPVFQGDSSGGYVLSSPQTGTITSWSFLSGGVATGNQFLLRVLQPANGNGTQWTAVGTSAPEAVTSAPSVDGVEGPFAVSIPIQAGDRIALQPQTDNMMPIETGAVGADGYRTFTGPLADGSTASIDLGQAADSGQVVAVQATVTYSPPPSPPVDVSLPAISGIPTAGQPLTCSPGGWTGSPSFSYVWNRDGVPIPGQVSQAHTIGAAEVGHSVTCTVVAANAGGSARATSGGVVPGPATIPPPTQPTLPRIHPTGVYELRVKGIEVIQSTQTKVGSQLEYMPTWAGAGIPSPYFNDGSVAKTLQQASYWGVSLAAGQQTVARVFVDLAEGVPVGGVTVALYGYAQDGRALPGSPLLPDYGPTTLAQSGSPYVLESERLDPSGGFVFELPASWEQATNGYVNLTAVADGPPPARYLRPRTECNDSVCQAERVFTLKSLFFVSLPQLRIAPVNMSPARKFVTLRPTPETLPPPSQVFSRVGQLMPGGNHYTLLPYQGWIDTSAIEAYTSSSSQCLSYVQKKDANGNPVYDVNNNPVLLTGSALTSAVANCKNDAYYQAIVNWSVNNLAQKVNGRYSYDLAVGVNTRSRGEASSSRTIANIPYDNPNNGFSAAQPVGFVNISRPVTSVLHEIGHEMGLAHAGLGVANASGQFVCPDSVVVTGGEQWSPDNYGRLQGWEGFWQSSLGLLRAIHPLFLEREDTDANPLYDLMSYCASTDDANNLNAWLSPHNWQREFSALQSFGHRLAGLTTFARRHRADSTSHAAAASLLLVSGVLDSAGGYISDVQPTSTPIAGVGDDAIVVRAYASSGALITTSHVAIDSGDRHSGEIPVSLVTATVPAGADRIELVSNGRVVDVRSRPVHAPVVKVLAPAARSFVGAGGTVVIRWAASDQTRTPLSASVDYSRNGGRTWLSIVESVPTTQAVTLPSALLAGSRDARVRVRISDGFNQTTAISPIFRAAGAPPAVHLDTPIAGESVYSSSTITFAGGAIDDTGAELTGRSLAWYDGRTLLGRGAAVTVDGLAPGRHAVRLVARDSSGRTAIARVTLTVGVLAPQVLSLSVPSSVSRHSRTVRIVISVSEPSVLVVGRKRTPIDRRPRTVAIPLPRGLSSSVHLMVSVRAYRKTVPIALALTRR